MTMTKGGAANRPLFVLSIGKRVLYMQKEQKRKLALMATALALLGIGGLAVYNNIPYRSTMRPDTRIKTQEQITSTHSDTYLPMFKDSNGVCGIAKDANGNMVAIASPEVCPTNETLAQRYGYEYVSLTEQFRPATQGDSCGTAKFLKNDNRIGKRDLAKLSELAGGDLEHIVVAKNDKDVCPTSQELSEMVTNSIGVPVHFEYNDFNANPNKYPVVTVNQETYSEEIPAVAAQDISIARWYGNKPLVDRTGSPIPIFLINNDSNDLCENNYPEKCTLQYDNSKGYLYLENYEKHNKYNIKSQNGVDIPLQALTRGAWDVCQGLFSQCDFMPDEDNQRTGLFINNATEGSYHAPVLINDIEIE